MRQLRTNAPRTNLHPKESLDMSTYLAAKECPFTYLDCVATHGRMGSMRQRMPTDFSCFTTDNVTDIAGLRSARK